MPLFGPPNIDKLKRKRDVTALLKALSHKDVAVQLSAENALGELGTAIAWPLATAARHAWTAKVRHAATDTLRKLGTAGVEAIITHAIDEGEHPVEVVEIVGQLGELQPAAVEALVARLQDKDVWARLWAASALGEMEDTRGAEVAIAALSDDDEGVREAAAYALENIGGPEAEQALAQYRAQQ